MKTLTHKKGYSLVEVLVAVAILMLAIVGPLTIAAKSIQSAQYAKQQTTAFFLAQEGINIINAMRNDAALEALNSGSDTWNWYTSGLDTKCDGAGCGIDFSMTLSNPNTFEDCPADCILKFDDSGDALVYTHSGSNDTIYTRTITLSEPEPAQEVIVEVTVSWDSHLFGGAEQTTTLTTSLFNTYAYLNP